MVVLGSAIPHLGLSRKRPQRAGGKLGGMPNMPGAGLRLGWREDGRAAMRGCGAPRDREREATPGAVAPQARCFDAERCAARPSQDAPMTAAVALPAAAPRRAAAPLRCGRVAEAGTARAVPWGTAVRCSAGSSGWARHACGAPHAASTFQQSAAQCGVARPGVVGSGRRRRGRGEERGGEGEGREGEQYEEGQGWTGEAGAAGRGSAVHTAGSWRRRPGSHLGATARPPSPGAGQPAHRSVASGRAAAVAGERQQ